MKARPILFSTPMVQALLEGRKTQTRRIIKPQPYIDNRGNFCWKNSCYGQDSLGSPHIQKIASPIPWSHTKKVGNPFGKPGDLLWVRENYYLSKQSNHLRPSEDKFGHVMYKAGGGANVYGKLRPSIFMPRWASRITLKITDISVERLQDISEEDAKAEGLSKISKDGHLYKYGIPDSDGLPGTDNTGWPWHDWEVDPRKAYKKLWQSINGVGSWNTNPWVWVVEFEVIKQNVDEVLK